MRAIDTNHTSLHTEPACAQKPVTLWRWVRWIAGGLIVFVFLLLGAGATYQAIATANDQQRLPPPGQLVDVGGFRLHTHCLGEAAAGTPTVSFGAGGDRWSIDWRLIQPAISQAMRTCVYDRAGLGWSEASLNRPPAGR